MNHNFYFKKILSSNAASAVTQIPPKKCTVSRKFQKAEPTFPAQEQPPVAIRYSSETSLVSFLLPRTNSLSFNPTLLAMAMKKQICCFSPSPSLSDIMGYIFIYRVRTSSSINHLKEVASLAKESR